MTTRLSYLLPSLLLAACATDASDLGEDGAGGKADDASSFLPTFCGVNILESAGPVFVGEVCIGTQRGPADAIVPMLRVSFTDNKTELYKLTEGEDFTDYDIVYAQRRSGEKHELRVDLDDDDLPTNISGSIDRGFSFSAPLAPAATKVTCYMSRLSSVPQGYSKVQATVRLDGEHWLQANPLEAFDGEYQFTLYSDTDNPLAFDVLMQENKHIEDEIDNFGCTLEDVAPNTSFCEKEVEINRNLGIDENNPLDVHAFNFWCRSPALAPVPN